MKKLLPVILVLSGLVLIFAACRQNTEIVENSCPYALMHDGNTYYYTGEAIYEKIKITDEMILGKVTSVVPESSMPEVDGQANIEISGSPYIRHELSGDGLLVLIDGEWIIFEKRAKNV